LYADISARFAEAAAIPRMRGFGSPDAVLRKVYGENARRAFQRARRSTE